MASVGGGGGGVCVCVERVRMNILFPGKAVAFHRNAAEKHEIGRVTGQLTDQQTNRTRTQISQYLMLTGKHEGRIRGNARIEEKSFKLGLWVPSFFLDQF